MADEADKAAESAEKAYAAAAAGNMPDKAPSQGASPASANTMTPKQAKAPEKQAPEPAPARKDVTMAETAKKPAAKKAPARKAPAKKTAVKSEDTVAAKKTVAKAAPKKVAPKKAPAKKPAPKSTPVQTKEPIMAKTTDFTKTVEDTVSEVQTRAKEAYEKSTEMAGEVGEFTKGNVEALVESGKILSEGMQDISKTYTEEAKSAFETLTADMKEMAAVKSPTELFQLQGKLMRRNFDSMVAMGSKSSEALIKLANDSMAPISGRMSIAADKVSKISA